MAFVLADSDHEGSASATTLDAPAVTVAAGNLVAVWTKWEGATTTSAVATSGGADSFTGGTLVNHTNNDLNARWHYLLSATTTGSVTYRLTLGAARPFVAIQVWVFTPDAGETVTLDAQNTGQGNSIAPTSGAIATTGTDEVVLGGYGEYVGNQLFANPTINGVAADGSYRANGEDDVYTASWYRILTTTFAAGTAVGENSSAPWICNIIAFKSAAAAATDGGLSNPIYRVRLRQF